MISLDHGEIVPWDFIQSHCFPWITSGCQTMSLFLGHSSILPLWWCWEHFSWYLTKVSLWGIIGEFFFIILVFNNNCISYKLQVSFLSYEHCKFWNQSCVPHGILCYKTQSRQIHDPYLPGWALELGISEAREAPRTQRLRTHSGCLTCLALTLQNLTSCSKSRTKWLHCQKFSKI